MSTSVMIFAHVAPSAGPTNMSIIIASAIAAAKGAADAADDGGDERLEAEEHPARVRGLAQVVLEREQEAADRGERRADRDRRRDDDVDVDAHQRGDAL